MAASVSTTALNYMFAYETPCVENLQVRVQQPPTAGPGTVAQMTEKSKQEAPK